MEAADFLPSREHESRRVTWAAVGVALLVEAVLRPFRYCMIQSRVTIAIRP